MQNAMPTLKTITITRGEGPVDACGKPEAASSWRAADAILRIWSDTAPATGGYDKCDFTIEWTDGAMYDGRYDLKHHSVESCDLSGHVRGFLGFYAGTACPNHMTQERYAAFLQRADDDMVAECKRMLAAYPFAD